MEPIVVGGLGVLAMLVLLALGVHVGIGMLVVGLAGFAAIGGLIGGLGMLATTPYSTTASFAFTVLPMFILMGEFAMHGGIAAELYDAATRWLGHLAGGLAMATTAACAAFGACSGVSVATAAMFTRLALPEMRKYNYDDRLSCGCIAASGTLAVMIPPSGVMVIYGIMTDQSIGRLLIAGIIPGILSALMFAMAIYTIVRLNPSLARRTPVEFSWKERFIAIKWLIPMGLLFVMVVGGIYIGVFTPTEGGAVGAFITGLMALLRRRLTSGTFVAALMDTAKTTAMVFLIIIGAMIFGKFLAVTGVVVGFGNVLMNLGAPHVVILLLMLSAYIVLGMFMDVIAMMALTLPVFFPVVQSLGLDPIWFGILVVKVVEIGLITPPVGMNAYVVRATAGDVKLEAVFQGILPFLIADLVTTTLLVAFPAISVWLPGTMGH
ncbi:TRAP transporter large permease [Chloroflexota bacterium]